MLRNRGQEKKGGGKTAKIYTVLGGSSVLAIAGAIGCVLRSGKALCVAVLRQSMKNILSDIFFEG